MSCRSFLHSSTQLHPFVLFFFSSFLLSPSAPSTPFPWLSLLCFGAQLLTLPATLNPTPLSSLSIYMAIYRN
ncbi:hypothetical protein F5Y09DRAFT_323170, partial [Xylaria sp. FL1042]